MGSCTVYLCTSLSPSQSSNRKQFILTTLSQSPPGESEALFITIINYHQKDSSPLTTSYTRTHTRTQRRNQRPSKDVMGTIFNGLSSREFKYRFLFALPTVTVSERREPGVCTFNRFSKNIQSSNI